MPFKNIHRVTCNGCGDRIDVLADSRPNVSFDNVTEIGWHIHIVGKDYEYYCHNCWLVRTINQLRKRIVELQGQQERFPPRPLMRGDKM